MVEEQAMIDVDDDERKLKEMGATPSSLSTTCTTVEGPTRAVSHFLRSPLL